MARATANVEALACLRRLEAEGGGAGPDDHVILARWSGWGAVPGVFDPADARFGDVRRRLEALLDAEEMAAAARNTLNAHYTDAALVQAIWSGLAALGFEGGNVLEPGCGSGTFIGFAPANTHMVGVELDPTTAAIARRLYPDAQVLGESFADTRIPEATFDAVVGNVPFGKIALHDPIHNPSGASIHNHFIIKALHLTRPGGLVGVLSSRYTLDARNPAARREIAELGDLIGAVRLPEGAHRRAAGTDVVTDLLVLRRRSPGETRSGAAFERTTTLDVAGGRVVVNEYFVANPAHVLGEIYCGRGVYGAEECLVRGERDAAPALGAALVELAGTARARGLSFLPPSPARDASQPIALVSRSTGRPDGHIEISGSGFSTVKDGRLIAYDCPHSQQGELRALIGLRDTMAALLEAEATTREDTPQIAELRHQLNRRYDAYI